MLIVDTEFAEWCRNTLGTDMAEAQRLNTTLRREADSAQLLPRQMIPPKAMKTTEEYSQQQSILSLYQGNVNSTCYLFPLPVQKKKKGSNLWHAVLHIKSKRIL